MLQTVLRIPHEVAGVPIFGWGWVAWAFLLALGGVVVSAIFRPATRHELLNTAPMLLLMTALAVWVLPSIEEVSHDGTPIGLPIRGYGVMLVLAVTSGFGLTIFRGRRMGFPVDRVLNMLIGMFVAGIVGARVFHVIQYWKDIRDPESWTATWIQVLKFNEGGLVVYGSMISGLLWVLGFTWRQKWPLLRVGDMIAPGMLLGLSLGRIGCLLNGCCHGGVCDNEPFALCFPQGSPPYMSQLHTGELFGARFVRTETGVKVDSLEEGLAKESGVEPGETVLGLPLSAKGLRAAKLTDETRPLVAITASGRSAVWSYADLPTKSRRTRPAQIYSSINALLLCVLLLTLHPYRSRDGQLMLTLLTLYPITRFLLEIIRTDEPGRFGTELTISQWVSVGMLAIALVGWIILAKPRADGSVEGGAAAS